ncbi:MAG: plastocyanin/azurin family copper-binding protein [Candidatus Nitrosopumilus sp. bin_68KS]
METRDLIITIIAVVITVVGTTISSTVSETEILKPKPQFFAEIDLELNNSTHGEKIRAQNIGSSQAKNVEIFIESKNNIILTKNSCFESQHITNEQNFILLELSQFSTDIDCILEFYDLPHESLSTLIITANDANGYQYDFTRDDEHLGLLSPFIFFLSSLSYWETAIPAVIISYVIASILITIVFFRYTQRKKLIEKSKLDEYELEKKYSKLRREMQVDKFENTSSKNQHIEKMIDIHNEMVASRTVTYYPHYSNLIHKFFIKYTALEKLLFNITNSPKYDHGTKTTVHRIKELKNKEQISNSLYSQLQQLVDFRDSISHNAIKLSFSNLRQHIEFLETVLIELQSVKPSPEYIVKIPVGTAVPGCEETHSCFEPHQCTIKQNGNVTWENVDSAAHTITSGTPDAGPSGKFDSGLIMSNNTFSCKLKEKGTYHYFCMVHPWQTGIIVVE